MSNNIDFEKLSNVLYSGLVCDTLDFFGYRNQSLGREFFPVLPEANLFGRAYTVVAKDIFEMPEDALVNQCRSIDDMKPGDIYVLSFLGKGNCGIWGEIMSTGARVKGGLGAIIDGVVRDTKMIMEMGFPVFCKGHLPTTSKGRAEITEWQVPVMIDGVRINPGDLIFADIDGVAIIPQEIADKVIERALQVLSSENVVRDKILNGDSIVDTYIEIGAI